VIFIGGSLSWAPSYIQNNLKFFGVLDFKARAEKCKEIMVSVKKTNKRFLGFWHTLYKLSYSLHFFPIFASFKEKKSTTNNESLFWANMRERKKEKTEMNKWSRVCYWYIDKELRNFRFPLIHEMVGSLKGQACNVFAFKTDIYYIKFQIKTHVITRSTMMAWYPGVKGYDIFRTWHLS